MRSISKKWIGLALLSSATAAWVVGAPALADDADARANTYMIAKAKLLRSIGQAVHLYANNNKGYLPPSLDNEAFQRDLNDATRALVTDPALISPFTLSGASVKITKIRGHARTPMMLYPLDDGSLLTLFVDGHVERLVTAKLSAGHPTTTPTTGQTTGDEPR